MTMVPYNPSSIEEKWKARWKETGIFEVDIKGTRPFYCLVEFPYPSGEGLHVGHTRSYAALDVVARKKRMEGDDVLFPMGWDAFGLPAENFAIKTGKHPAQTTEKNISRYREQLQSLGLSFDWSREVSTIDPAYYKWTQWIVTKLFNKGLAYKKKTQVNWCTSCNVVLANEEVEGGVCERCGGEVIGKEKEQWMLEITAYARRLIKDLDQVSYPSRVKKQQIDWIGESQGACITFPLQNKDEFIEVFTTRPDTLFGVTYLVVAPEHPIVESIVTEDKKDEIFAYITETKKKSQQERLAQSDTKTGVWTGAYVSHPATQEPIPVWIGDYVIMEYGTGAVMAVPAHDQRDYEFAQIYNLPVRVVIESQNVSQEGAYEGEGIVVNSGVYSGQTSQNARKHMTLDFGEEKVIYKLRDWVFARQRYWGEPMPLVFCTSCKEQIEKGDSKGRTQGEIRNPGWTSVAQKDLPVLLPQIQEYKTTKEGESPLAGAKEWVHTTCPHCGGDARRETDTMPQWAGSSWYYIRYIDPKNDTSLGEKEILDKWLPVNWYNGGMEHTTLHLLYSRFWHKFLYDEGIVSSPEPYIKRTSHGLILGEGGEKMSKSKGNVINPDDIVKEFGADALRLYILFIGPFEESIPWNNNGLIGMERFLRRVWNLYQTVSFPDQGDRKIDSETQKTVRKVSSDIDTLKYNTAIAALMSLLKIFEEKKDAISKESAQLFLLLLSPFAPFITEELWETVMKERSSIQKSTWPSVDEKKIQQEHVTIAIQVNGKVRGTITVAPGSKEEVVWEELQHQKQILSYIEGKEIKKKIFVQDKIFNIVV